MKIEEKHIKEIKKLFYSMKTKNDLLTLLNYVKVCLYGEKTYLFTITQLNYHYASRNKSKRYTEFKIKKKSGTERTISAPNPGLMEIQKCLNVVLQHVSTLHSSATGFVVGKSIVDNAKMHTNSLYVYNLDLKDFFPSIDQARVWGRLKVAPFNLNEKTNRLELANIIAVLCCHTMEVERFNEETKSFVKEKRAVLPQGAPTSPVLSNIICERLDIRLNGVAKRFGLKYSRYADDITFSSMYSVFQNGGEVITEINRIVKEQNFVIKESKTRLQKQGYKQEVTGLVINEKPNVNKRYVSDIRKWLYLWEQYGYEKANGYFAPKYMADRGHVKSAAPSLKNVLAGKLEFLKMVKGKSNSTYKQLAMRLNDLISSNHPINNIISVWENEGIEKAMEMYYASKSESNETGNDLTTLFSI